MEYRTFRMPVVPMIDGEEQQVGPKYDHEDLGVRKVDYMRHYKWLHVNKHFTYTNDEIEANRVRQEESFHEHQGSPNQDGTIDPCTICGARHPGELLPSVPDLPTSRLEVDVCIRNNGYKLPEFDDIREVKTPQPYIDAFERKDARRDI